MQIDFTDAIRLTTLRQDCNAGKHIWRTWSANTVVDPVTFKPTGISHLVHYIDGEPTFRGCVVCGRKEQLKSEWASV
jgi:hypothetical protein